ncbi:MAG: hypothetical protein ACHQ9S_25500 [Candidatus Binatia bacterium]
MFEAVASIASDALQVASCACLGSVLGFAAAVEYGCWQTARGEASKPSQYWHWVKRVFWIGQLTGWCFLAWLLEDGPTMLFLPSAFLGFLAGQVAGLARPVWPGWVRRSITGGLGLSSLGYALDGVARGDPIYLGPAAVATSFAAGALVLFLALFGLMKVTGRGSLGLSFGIAAAGSFTLESGGPFLWMVLVAALAFGYSCRLRYLNLPDGSSQARAVGVGLIVLILAHTLVNGYFYLVASYGPWSSPNVSVAPYALGGIAVGFAIHRVASLPGGGVRRRRLTPA